MDPLDTMLHAAAVYVNAVEIEAKLRIARDETEAEIAASLLGNLNAATGKPHSDTSAKAAAKESAEVRAFRAELLIAERQTILTRYELEAARIRAWQTVGAWAAA